MDKISSDLVVTLRRPAKFTATLLSWYDVAKRNLPWRQTGDPYRVWVSEIMLQQTRVSAVLEYYKRFLRAFPNIGVLARADEQQVLAQWSGLGYYRRARMMHAAAKEIAGKRKKLPCSSEQLRELPGVGRYTAAAIASICFGERIAVVDGNVERVLNRIGGHDETDSLNYWASAQALIPGDRPGDFNQAMMELGATVCLPKVPDCKQCPVKKWCKTRGTHVTAKPSLRRKAHLNYLLAQDAKSVALVQRGKDLRLMAGMWELPCLSSPMKVPAILKLKHSITNTDYEVSVWTGARPRGTRQIQLSTLQSLPLTGLTRKILRRMGLLQHQRQ